MRILAAVIAVVFTATASFADSFRIGTADGHELGANFYGDATAPVSVLLLHQCNRDQRMWKPLLDLLLADGRSAMTVDARGFGESRNEQFDVSKSNEAYDQATRHFPSDVEYIYQAWLEKSDGAKSRAVVGASCGGAMASMLSGSHSEIGALILFSPAMRPYWFAEEKWAPLAARSDLPILGIVSIEDKGSIVGVERAVGGSKADLTQYIRYNGRRHGQPLFEHDPTIAGKMANWIGLALR